MRGFLLGAIIGGVAAMLVAPRRGEETREILRSRAEVWQDQVMAGLDQARSEIESMRAEMVSRLDEIRGQFIGPLAEPGMVAPPPEGTMPGEGA